MGSELSFCLWKFPVEGKRQGLTPASFRVL